jgi:hypothetical protein
MFMSLKFHTASKTNGQNTTHGTIPANQKRATLFTRCLARQHQRTTLSRSAFTAQYVTPDFLSKELAALTE